MEEVKQRTHKITRDYGLPDYFKFYTKKYKTGVSRKTFNNLITDYNLGIIDLVIEENLMFYVPFLGLEIFIKKDKRKPRIVNGRLINNVPIDWQATNKLWDKDEEAKEKKILVRYDNSHTSDYVFRIYCKKYKTKVKNRGLFKFKPNRIFQRTLSKRIKDPNKDNFDAFLLYKIK